MTEEATYVPQDEYAKEGHIEHEEKPETSTGASGHMSCPVCLLRQESVSATSTNSTSNTDLPQDMKRDVSHEQEELAALAPFKIYHSPSSQSSSLSSIGSSMSLSYTLCILYISN